MNVGVKTIIIDGGNYYPPGSTRSTRLGRQTCAGVCQWLSAKAKI